MTFPARLRGLALCLLSAVAAAPTQAGARCAATPFSFDRAHSTIAVGGYVVRMANPDDDAHPTLWEGPVRIARPDGKTSCEAVFDNIGLIVEPLVAYDDAVLLLATVSGDNPRIAKLSLSGCKVEAGPNLFSPLSVANGRILSGGTPVPGAYCAR